MERNWRFESGWVGGGMVRGGEMRFSSDDHDETIQKSFSSLSWFSVQV